MLAYHLLLCIFVGKRDFKIVELRVTTNEILLILHKSRLRFHKGVQFFSFGVQIHLVNKSQFVL